MNLKIEINGTTVNFEGATKHDVAKAAINYLSAYINKDTIHVSKEMFCSTLEAIKNQKEHDRKCMKALQIVFADAFLCAYNNQEIENKLVEILQVATNDKHKNSWIEYWIYELECGKRYKHGSVTNADKSIIDLSTSEKLYEFLITQ